MINGIIIGKQAGGRVPAKPYPVFVTVPGQPHNTFFPQPPKKKKKKKKKLSIRTQSSHRNEIQQVRIAAKILR